MSRKALRLNPDVEPVGRKGGKKKSVSAEGKSKRRGEIAGASEGREGHYINECGSAVPRSNAFRSCGRVRVHGGAKRAETNHTQQEDRRQNTITRSFTGVCCLGRDDTEDATPLTHTHTAGDHSRVCVMLVGFQRGSDVNGARSVYNRLEQTANNTTTRSSANGSVNYNGEGTCWN